MEQKTYHIKSLMVGRKPRIGTNKYKTAIVNLFTKNNPHKTGEVPKEMLEYPNIEKVRINDLINISYYLEGNDIVINDLDEVHIVLDKAILTITGKQSI
ncbi:MAG: hypothetical protein Q7R76_00595 [Candidatus Woesearchaeota archaeon]|nr:hypothetical protein [Candidatus Woesearchaeota archaeon]